MERQILLSVIVLICINVMDSIMSAVVGPTLIFYVSELGGSQHQYGMMLSAVSLSSMIMIPVFGKWVDSNGNKYKVPYVVSFILGIVAYLIYFAAVLLPKGSIAVYSLMFSRFLDGASIASRTLAYSWVASAITPDKQRNVFTFLSSARTLGLILGPLANVLVDKIHTEFQIFGLTVPVTPTNSVGLLMVGGVVILIILTLLFLEEPPEKEAKSDESSTKTERKGVAYALSYFDIFFPVLTMFAVACNFNLILTALSPVARNMGWDPIQISTVTAYGCSIMAVTMIISVIVSMRNVSDMAMISFGIGCFFISGSLMYLKWTDGASYWQFTLPTYFMFFGYPFIGPANRSIYTKAIHSKKELEGSQGIMMSLLNQAFAVASFIAPTFIASFIVRTREEIDKSLSKRALTDGALYVPILSSLILAGLFYSYFFIDEPNPKLQSNDSVPVSETSTLLPSAKKNAPRASLLEISEALSTSSEVNRRLSVEIMGIPNPVDTKYEKELNENLLKDKKLWDELRKLDALEED